MNTFDVTLTVKHYETDMNDHVSNAVYYEWADQARTEYLLRAGIALDALQRAGKGPVILEAHMRYLAELRAGQELRVTCEPQYGEGKTMTVVHRYLQADGTMAAELILLMGVFDLTTRRLLDNPLNSLRAIAPRPELL
ncbi:acyl-CoA thioesterase [Streptomyces flaveolus]|uniref:acyl-CoA thioesterase n=1 Tax=Streptomyces flaveolus TaxID=67297 RepID=UPI003449D527